MLEVVHFYREVNGRGDFVNTSHTPSFHMPDWFSFMQIFISLSFTPTLQV